MLLEELSWQEVAKKIEEAARIILPIGSNEQHGEHLPVGTDARITGAIAKEVGERTGTLVAPVLSYGINLEGEAHFPGAISLSFEALRGVVNSISKSFVSWGVKDIFIITAHGCASENTSFAHQEAIKAGLLSIEQEGSARTHIIYPYWESFNDILERDEGMEHGGEGETSLMLYLAEGLVDMASAVDRPEAEQFTFRAFPEGVSQPGDLPQGGSEGFPSAASAEKGKLLFERVVTSAQRYILSCSK